MDGIGEGARDVGRVGDQEVVLGDWHGEAADVSFLEGIGADEVVRDLAGDRDAVNRVHLAELDDDTLLRAIRNLGGHDLDALRAA